MWPRVLLVLILCEFSLSNGPSHVAAAEDPVDLGGVREEHVMIPMRDGKRLSAYLYFPPGAGP
jgi:predicted acyl esterase